MVRDEALRRETRSRPASRRAIPRGSPFWVASRNWTRCETSMVARGEIRGQDRGRGGWRNSRVLVGGLRRGRVVRHACGVLAEQVLIDLFLLGDELHAEAFADLLGIKAAV